MREHSVSACEGSREARKGEDTDKGRSYRHKTQIDTNMRSRTK